MFKSIASKKIMWKWVIAGGLAVMLAFGLFWIPAIAKFGLEKTANFNSINLNHIDSITTTNSGGGLLYSWSDVVVAKTVSKMDNPIGVGWVLFFLIFLSLLILLAKFVIKPKKIFSEENVWKLTSLFWLLIAFAGIHGNRLPFPMLMPHRWWSILAIPVALLSVEGFFALGKISKTFKIPKGIFYFVIIIGIIITSGYPKYVVETSYWPPGTSFGSMQEVGGYIKYVKSLPEGTKVFPFCSNEFKVLAFDKLVEPWNPDYSRFKKSVFEKTPDEVASWLRSRGYEYMTFDSSCLRKYGVNETNIKLDEFFRHSSFTPVGQVEGFFMFSIV